MKSHNSGILTTTFVVYDCFYPLFLLYTEDSHVVQVRAEDPKVPEAARPERAEALSPGHRPGYNGYQQGAL